MTNTQDKATLRKLLRQKRTQITYKQRQVYSIKLCQHIAQSSIFRKSRYIAIYHPLPKEIDLRYLLSHNNKKFYLPIVLFNKSLRFALYNHNTILSNNRFNIKEPKTKRYKTAQKMDLILMPLLGFDAMGNRLGMGAGFYDRTLQFRHWRGDWKKPYLLGIAYCFQQVDALPQDTWDIPLDNILCI